MQVPTKKPCRFGSKCQNPKCHFDHSSSSSIATKTSGQEPRRNNSSKSCRYGARCTRKKCQFSHPSALKTGTVTSFEIGSSTSGLSDDIGQPMSSIAASLSAPSTTSLPFCSIKEFQERQALHQVSIYEATADTSSLPQSQRVLDPELAVAKYRRSAAGSEHDDVHSKSTLEALLQHLITIGANMRPTSNHTLPRDNWQRPWTEFLVERLRACQADATRLLDSEGSMKPSWHVRMARLILWIRYWMPWDDAFLEKTTNSMLSTALEQYWAAGKHLSLEQEETSRQTCYDDEILTYSALLRLVKKEESSLCQSLLLDFDKHVPIGSRRDRVQNYPRFEEALKLTANISCGDYYTILHLPYSSPFSILDRCCLAPCLAYWRYQLCRYYNVSFGKEEGVADLDRLLGMADWSALSKDHVQHFIGLPYSFDEEENTIVIFKKSPMPEVPHFEKPYRDHKWVFGADYLESQEQFMNLRSQDIQKLLQHGEIFKVDSTLDKRGDID